MRPKWKSNWKFGQVTYTRYTILMGDLNLDFLRKFDESYSHGALFTDFEDHLSSLIIWEQINI